MNENVLSKELTRRDQIVIALIAKYAYEAILICHEENEDEETLDRYLEILQTLYDVDSSKAAALVLILLKQSTYDEELLNAAFEMCKSEDGSAEHFVSEFIFFHLYG